MKSEISTAQVNKYRAQIQEREDKQVPWDIALDIVCDTVIEQGKEIARLRFALSKIAQGTRSEISPRLNTVAAKALQTPSGAAKVAF